MHSVIHTYSQINQSNSSFFLSFARFLPNGISLTTNPITSERQNQTHPPII